MRATVTILVVVLAGCVTLIGCDSDDEPGDDQPDEQAEQPADDAPPDGVVAYGEDFELTLDDVEQAVHRVRLVAPEVEQGRIPRQQPDWIQDPHLQTQFVRNLVHFKLVRDAADERGLTLDDDRLHEVLAEHRQLRRYLPLFEDDDSDDADALLDELHDADLQLDDVRHLAEDIAYDQLLADELADEFPEEDLWDFYQIAEDTADAIVASIRNTPSPDEIDRADREYDAEIRSHFRDNRDEYMTPSRATLTQLLPANNADPDVLEEAAERLADGEDPHQIGDDLQLTVEEGVDVSRPRNPQAHQSDVGDAGVLDDPRQDITYAWLVEDRTEPERRSLDRALRREIASQIIRQQEGITPSNEQKAQQARELLAEPDSGAPLDDDQVAELISTLEDEGFDVEHTDEFSIRLDDRVPEVGLAENLAEAIRELSLDDPISEPVLDRNLVHVARLVDRSEPDRDHFEDEYDDFRSEFIEQNQGRFVSDFVQQAHQDRGIEVHIDVVADEFGITQKKPQGQ